MGYLVQAGLGQWSLYNHERPLQEVTDDPRTSDEVRERIKWIPEIKKHVESELGVKATGNYTTFVDLKRPYVIWSITVAEPFEVRLKEWSFPIVGAFPYLGFFREDMAREWLEEYRGKGYDTFIRGVSAYSTLGYLRDPLLSSMLGRKKADLVNLIFHETTHGQVYLKGEGSFNEQVASYIGDYGERAWIAKTYGAASDEYRAWENERADRRRLGAMLRTFSDELKKFYASIADVSPDGRSAAKQARFDELAKRLTSETWKTKGLPRAAKLITNNAALLAYLTYEDEQGLFDLLDQKCGGRLKDALRYLKDFADAWDRRSEPNATPQALLGKRLLGDAARDVCLHANDH